MVASLRSRDLALHAAALTFYAAIALVPSLLVALAVLGLALGEGRVRGFAGSVAAALPEALGAPAAVRALVDAALGLGWLGLVVAVFPATLYGEGLRRTFVSLAGGRDAYPGWRGRLLILPLLAAAPALLLAVLAVTPLLADLLSPGGFRRTALAVYLALNIDWVVLWVALAYVYRAVGPRRPRWSAAVIGSGVTAAFVAGFVQGFVLFLALPIDLSAPFGRLPGVGEVAALAFWLWMLHAVGLVGYVLTLALAEEPGPAMRGRPGQR